MSALESVIAATMAKFEERLREGLDSTEATPEEAEILRAKFTDAFAENIRLGLVKTFGTLAAIAPGTAADLQPENEVMAAEVEQMQNALETVVSMRARYPEVVSKTLDITLTRNRETLKILKADVTVPDAKIPESDPSLRQVHEEGLKTAKQVVEQSRDNISEALEKSSRLLKAFEILESNRLAESE